MHLRVICDLKKHTHHYYSIITNIIMSKRTIQVRFIECPTCKHLGLDIEMGMKKCINDDCSVDIFWAGGFIPTNNRNSI